MLRGPQETCWFGGSYSGFQTQKTYVLPLEPYLQPCFVLFFLLLHSMDVSLFLHFMFLLMLRTYSSLCTRIQEPCRVLELEHRLAACKAITYLLFYLPSPLGWMLAKSTVVLISQDTIMRCALKPDSQICLLFLSKIEKI